MKRFFSRKKGQSLDGAEADEFDGDLSSNDSALKRQKALLMAGAGAVVVCAMVYIMAPSKKDMDLAAKSKDATETTVSVDSMVNRNMTDKEWMNKSEVELAQQGQQIKSLETEANRIRALEQQIQDLQGTNSSMQSDGTRVLSAYETENQQLRAALAAEKSARAAGPSSLYGAGAPQTYRPAGQPGLSPATQAAAAAVAPVAPVRGNEIKLVSFSGEAAGTAVKVDKGTTVYTDSPNYLPPNSIARAKVVVGVDATAGVRSQSDPLPVVLRITGPARSVYSEGRLFRTKIDGCMVNGAAQGDLSSEKVYVKLQRMTCPQPGGRFAVSEVKGFIAFGGKTGVRGRVVSREGGLVGQAFVAGMFGGFGRGASMNTNSILSGSNVTVNGKRQQLSLGDIAQGGLGEGVATAADSVSKYLIERAEQYQPVIEMPTGIDVEIVFLDGVFIRN